MLVGRFLVPRGWLATPRTLEAVSEAESNDSLSLRARDRFAGNFLGQATTGGSCRVVGRAKTSIARKLQFVGGEATGFGDEGLNTRRIVCEEEEEEEEAEAAGKAEVLQGARRSGASYGGGARGRLNMIGGQDAKHRCLVKVMLPNNPISRACMHGWGWVPFLGMYPLLSTTSHSRPLNARTWTLAPLVFPR